jgi:hypothetical protein
MAVLHEKPVSIGDLIKSEYDAAYCRESKLVTNPEATEITLVVGYPMDDNVPLEAAGIANCDGLLMEHAVLAGNEVRLLPVLARGPCTIDDDALPTTDYADAAINAANFRTAIDAIEPKIIRRFEPPHQTEHDT